MRTYVVDSDFWDRCCTRLKKLSNVHWLSLGALASVILCFTLLLSISSQRSEITEWHLKPYQTNVMPLSSVAFANQRLVLKSDHVRNTTKLYLAPTCPVQHVMEEEETEKKVSVRHRGKQQQDFKLQTGATIDFSLKGADGGISVHVFSDWDDEREYEHHPATEESVWSGIADERNEAAFSLTAEKDDTYVFLFQGMTGQAATAHYKVSRVSYDLTVIPKSAAIDVDEYCTDQKCTVPLSRHKAKSQKCLVIESTSLATHDTIMQVHLQVNNHHWLIFLVSLLPLVVSLVYIKYGKEPAVIGGSQQQWMPPGYALVGGDGDQSRIPVLVVASLAAYGKL